MKILLAIDGSPYSDAALESVCRRPLPPNSEVRILTVDAPMDSSRLGGASPAAWEEVLKQLRAEANQRLHDAEAYVRKQCPDLRFTTMLGEGSPKEVILDEAARWGADLIVIGSHGYGAVKRFLLGSVSQAVAVNAPCSVEIVRIRPHESGDAAVAKQQSG